MGNILCLVGCFSTIIWTPTVLSVLYACVLYFCLCSAQLSIFHMERRSRNTLIIIIIIIIVLIIITWRRFTEAEDQQLSFSLEQTTDVIAWQADVA